MIMKMMRVLMLLMALMITNHDDGAHVADNSEVDSAGGAAAEDDQRTSDYR